MARIRIQAKDGRVLTANSPEEIDRLERNNLIDRDTVAYYRGEKFLCGQSKELFSSINSAEPPGVETSSVVLESRLNFLRNPFFFVVVGLATVAITILVALTLVFNNRERIRDSGETLSSSVPLVVNDSKTSANADEEKTAGFSPPSNLTPAVENNSKNAVAQEQENGKPFLDLSEFSSVERVPNPLIMRFPYPGGSQERRKNVPPLTQTISDAARKSFEFIAKMVNVNSDSQPMPDYNVWGTMYSGRPQFEYLNARIDDGPFILPTSSEFYDLFYFRNDLRVKRAVARKAKGETEKLRSFAQGEFIVDLKAAALLLSESKFDEGCERLDIIQDRLTVSPKVLKNDPKVAAVLAVLYYFAQTLEIKKIVTEERNIEKAEEEFAKLTNCRLFKAQQIRFRLGIFRDFAYFLDSKGFKNEAVVYLQHCLDYCQYVEKSSQATNDERKETRKIAFVLNLELSDLYADLELYEKTIDVLEVLREKMEESSAKASPFALFGYDTKEIYKKLALAYRNVGEIDKSYLYFKHYVDLRKEETQTNFTTKIISVTLYAAALGKANASNEVKLRSIRNIIVGERYEAAAQQVDFVYEFDVFFLKESASNALRHGRREELVEMLDALRTKLNDVALFKIYLAEELLDLANNLYSYLCFQDAAYYYAKCLEICGYFFGFDSPTCITPAINLATTLSFLEGFEQAKKILDRLNLTAMLEQYVVLVEERRAVINGTRKLVTDTAMEIEDDEDDKGLVLLSGLLAGAVVNEIFNETYGTQAENTPGRFLKKIADNAYNSGDYPIAMLSYDYLKKIDRQLGSDAEIDRLIAESRRLSKID